MNDPSPAPSGTRSRRAFSLASFTLTNPIGLPRQQSESLEDRITLTGTHPSDENYTRDLTNLLSRQRTSKSTSETDPQKKDRVGGWKSFVVDKIMTAGDSLSDIGKQDHQGSVHSIISQGRSLILGWRNRNDRRRNTSNSSWRPDKPYRPRSGSLCPVFNDPWVIDMVARAEFARKMSDSSTGSKVKFGALCPIDTMEIQFTKMGSKGADIAVLTSKGILNHNLTEEFNPFQLNTFRQIFDMYDKNGDNVINVEELRGILEILGYSPTPDEVKTILERFDQDNSGTIDFDEYLVLIQHWIEQDEEQIYEAFKVFDRDGDGFVSAQELKRALTQYGEQFTEDEANEFFNMMDTDGDGVINYEEFVEYLRSMQKYSTE